jgi:hypothetical protein
MHVPRIEVPMEQDSILNFGGGSFQEDGVFESEMEIQEGEINDSEIFVDNEHEASFVDNQPADWDTTASSTEDCVDILLEYAQNDTQPLFGVGLSSAKYCQAKLLKLCNDSAVLEKGSMMMIL